MVVDASGCQLPLAPLVNISLSPGKTLSASVVSLTKLDWNKLTAHPEPEVSADKTARGRQQPKGNILDIYIYQV